MYQREMKQNVSEQNSSGESSIACRYVHNSPKFIKVILSRSAAILALISTTSYNNSAKWLNSGSQMQTTENVNMYFNTLNSRII